MCSVGISNCFSRIISTTGAYFGSSLVVIELIVTGFGLLKAPVPAGANGFNGLKAAAKGFEKFTGFIGKLLVDDVIGCEDRGFPIV